MPRTLLLADDSVTIQKVVGITFASEDVDLVTVDNGDDALIRARQVRPDAVLADISMPGLNGYELCRAIKRDPDLGHVPVLLLTGTFETFDGPRAADVGADGHISKPFEAQALIDQVNALFARAKRAAEPPTPAPTFGAMPAARAAAPQQAPAPSAQRTTPQQAPAPVAQRSAAPQQAPAPPALPPVPPSSASAGQLPSSDDLAFEPADFDRIEAEFGPPARRGAAPANPRPAAATPATSDAETVLAFVRPPPPKRVMDDEISGFVDPLSEAPATPTRKPPAEQRFGRSSFVDPLAESEAPTPRPPLPSVSDEEDSFNRLPPPRVRPPQGLWEPAASPPAAAAPTPAARPSDPFALEASAPAQPAELPDELPWAESVPAGEVEPEEVSAVTEPYESPEEDATPSPATPRPALPTGAAGATLVDSRALAQALEKMAWEAFGPVSEQIVREAVKKLEEIAWEVLPKLAESLIREEIARLRAAPPED